MDAQKTEVYTKRICEMVDNYVGAASLTSLHRFAMSADVLNAGRTITFNINE